MKRLETKISPEEWSAVQEILERRGETESEYLRYLVHAGVAIHRTLYARESDSGL